MIPDRNTEHDTYKAMPIEIAGTIVCSMVKKLWDICKFSTGFGDRCVVNTQKHRLCFQRIWDQLERDPGGRVHKSGIIYFCVGTGIVERIQWLFCNARQKVLVQKADGMNGFQSQYGKYQQKQCICGGNRKSFKINWEILKKKSCKVV